MSFKNILFYEKTCNKSNFYLLKNFFYCRHAFLVKCIIVKNVNSIMINVKNALRGIF